MVSRVFTGGKKTASVYARPCRGPSAQVLSAVVVAMVLLLVGGCGNGPERHVALPSAGASPQDVVRAYVNALDAHDIDTARALLTSEHSKDVKGQTDSWFSNVRSIADLSISAPVTESGRSDTAAKGYRFVVYVPVEFTLRQRHQVSMPDGPTNWGYLLARNTDTTRWLIVVEGMG